MIRKKTWQRTHLLLYAFSLLLFIFNDQLLKGSGLLPGELTGKISDVCFFFFFPVSLVWILHFFLGRYYSQFSKLAVFISYLFSGLLFACLNLSPGFSDWMADFITQQWHIPTQFWPDRSDLWALLAIPFSWIFYFGKLRPNRVPAAIHFKIETKILRTALITASLLACLVSGRGGSHDPIYMKLAEFRDSFAVVKPDKIETKGKVVLMPNMLYISEPGKGIHIVDIKDKKNPKPVSLIKIPANVDMAIKGDVLYADSLMDLLVIDISDPKKPKLLQRVVDQFEYNPLVLLDAESFTNMRPGRKIVNDEVIVGWRRK